MLTVLLATYNRAKLLAEVLDSFCRLNPPSGGWKLVIVDNGSTDGTKQIIRDFVERLPLTYVLESRQGKNTALNAGISCIEGDLTVLTDDDVLPRCDWLIQMRQVADAHRDYSVFGGVILPKWETHPEEWLTKWDIPFGPLFSISSRSLKEGPVSPHAVFGPNMAVRTDIFADGHRFNELIGPSGSSYAMGSESEFVKRLAKAGHRAWHCKSAVVHHIILSSQMTKHWVLRRMIRFGRGQFRQNVSDGNRMPETIAGVPRYLLRLISHQYLRLLMSLLARDAEALFMARLEICYLLGCAIESRVMVRQKDCSLLSRSLRGQTVKLGNKC
jgi:L-malate glycosyltransferase